MASSDEAWFKALKNVVAQRHHHWRPGIQGLELFDEASHLHLPKCRITESMDDGIGLRAPERRQLIAIELDQVSQVTAPQTRAATRVAQSLITGE